MSLNYKTSTICDFDIKMIYIKKKKKKFKSKRQFFFFISANVFLRLNVLNDIFKSMKNFGKKKSFSLI